MEKTIVLISNGISGLLILGQFGVWDALIMFLLAGVIPGTHLSLPPFISLMIILVAGCAAIFYLRTALQFGAPLKKTLPKRRYSQI